MDAEKVVLDAMKAAAKPLKAGDVAELTGIPKDEVTKIIGKLKKAAKVESPKACYYVVK
ncbi:MAG TPA: MarR family transcriptional regulator [Candidatus Marinimicrobia bacterium]|nr:MAG: MarR family transcriptional regulator [Candidatus Marinimicrobia bacterium CG1_02_48_14]PJA51718.1 MAG: MarR family transcriptional regulator [Candidatus Marinimicrobia bacterium CG_4_9_14_3_um_filter_48_9]HCW74915.1 MarR family transcriptional regulator [Candidatus Neomarinimicrobiota bacterium]